MQCRIWKIILKVTGETQYSFGNAEYIVLTNDMDVTAGDIADLYLSSQYNSAQDVYIVSINTD